MKHHIVTAAILKNNNQYLCMQRGISKFEYMSYKYEFPGGKLEAGESFEEGLSRELHEELHIEVKVKPEHFFMTVDGAGLGACGYSDC
jgi:8-oxo-dGTP diphosphatase